MAESWNTKCGKITADGTRCQRPRGCRRRHKPPSVVPQAVNAALSLTEPKRDATAISFRRFRRYPRRLRKQAVEPLTEAAELTKQPAVSEGSGFVTAEALLRAINHPDTADRFVCSSVADINGRFSSPESGHCVAFPGSDFLLSVGATFDPATEDPSVEALQETDLWIEHLRPVLDSGSVWIGGRKWPSGDRAGRFEVNLTAVFPLHRKAEAILAGEVWRQIAIYTIHTAGSVTVANTSCDNDRPASL